MKKYFLVWLLFAVFSLPAFARWASQNDIAKVYDLWRILYTVKKDGTYVAETEFKVKILKDSAIASYGNYSLRYNGQSEKLTIISAKAVNKGKEFIVDPKFIEDKPLASSHNGFDQMRQILIAFPHIQVGSYIHIHYRRHYKIVPYQDFFSAFYRFSNFFAKNIDIKIKSDLPLFYKINNPGRFLKTSYRPSYKRGDKKYIFTVRLRRPLLRSIVDEEYMFTDPNLFPWIEISTSKEWSKMVKYLAPKYEQIIEEPLPKLHEKILQSAKKIKTNPEDQIDFIVSSLIEKIRYLGDWRPIKGGHIPRSLSVIAESSFGDCKDLSVSLAAILRKIGFKAQVALIYRNYAHHKSNEFTWSNMAAFNHAIVRAEINNKIYWLDATNSVSYSRGIFMDIADRPALVLQKTKSKMERTPKMHSDESLTHFVKNFDITEKKLIKVKTSIDFKGHSAIPFTGASLYTSKKSLDYHFVKFSMYDISTLNKWKVQDYDLSSRIVKNFSVEMSYDMKKEGNPYHYYTQMGPAFLVPWPGNMLFTRIRVRNRMSGLFLGSPQTIISISKLKNIKPVGKLTFDNCSTNSRWMEFNRQVESINPLTIKSIYKIKLPYITAKELNSRAFFQLQKNAKRCFTRFLMVYEKTN